MNTPPYATAMLHRFFIVQQFLLFGKREVLCKRRNPKQRSLGRHMGGILMPSLAVSGLARRGFGSPSTAYHRRGGSPESPAQPETNALHRKMEGVSVLLFDFWGKYITRIAGCRGAQCAPGDKSRRFCGIAGDGHQIDDMAAPTIPHRGSPYKFV